jgi:hypothetical protein
VIAFAKPRSIIFTAIPPSSFRRTMMLLGLMSSVNEVLFVHCS